MAPKLALAALITCAAALSSITTSAHVNTLPDCQLFTGGTACSDAFYLNGVPLGFTGETVLSEGADTLTLGGPLSGIVLDTTVAVIFTEQGTGTGPTAPVSDFVVAFTANSLTAQSDPFEGATVANVEALLTSGSLTFTNFQVVEETGGLQIPNRI